MSSSITCVVNAYFYAKETLPMRAEDLFPAGVDSVEVDGVRVRKGSIAAFIHNALALDQLDPEGEEYERAVAEIQSLAPALKAVRVFEVFSLRSDRVARIVAQAGTSRA
jgi:hypothetical protein